MFWKKDKKEVDYNIEDRVDGHKVIIREGEKSGKDSVELLELAAERNGFPIFKGNVKHAYESDFLKYKDKCPLCQSVTVQMMSNFAYATESAARLSTSHAGHFCSECPTVIIDDDVMRASISSGVQYGGVTSIETGYTDETSIFETFNGERPTYVTNMERTNIEGIMQSVNLIDDDSIYFSKDGKLLGKNPRRIGKNSSRLRKRSMSIKKIKKKKRS